jgi:uncharacterized cupredoxin-like copper-binding protein
MMSRRGFIGSSAAVLAGTTLVSRRAQAASIPEAPTTISPRMQPPLVPTAGPDYQPVVTLNGWTLPWRMNGDWKEFHLVAEPVVRENLKHAEQMKKFPEMEHDDPNGKRLAPKKRAEIVWKFTKAGVFEFGCLIPGHREAGMIGTVIVK